jgi:hypothetical protein
MVWCCRRAVAWPTATVAATCVLGGGGRGEGVAAIGGGGVWLGEEGLAPCCLPGCTFLSVVTSS